MHRFFIFNEQSEPTKEITPTKELFHQLTRVLRIRPNEKFVCIYNNLELITILEDDIIKVISYEEFKVEKENKLTLIQGAPMSKKLNTIIQKSTELDADEIIVWQSKRSTSVIRDFESKQERYEKIIVEACEQSRRNDIPKLSFLEDIENFNFKDKKVIVLYENEKNSLLVDNISVEDSEIVIVIGPEGGFEENEIKLLEDKGAIICSLGKNILRTETAAIASLAIVNSIVRK